MRAVWGQWEWNLQAILTPASNSSMYFPILSLSLSLFNFCPRFLSLRKGEMNCRKWEKLGGGIVVYVVGCGWGVSLPFPSTCTEILGSSLNNLHIYPSVLFDLLFYYSLRYSKLVKLSIILRKFNGHDSQVARANLFIHLIVDYPTYWYEQN